MFLRRDRVQLHGKTNQEYNTSSLDRPAWLPRLTFLSTARSNKFDQIVKNKMARTIVTDPVDSQKQFYKEHTKVLPHDQQNRAETNLMRPRFAHLEELERRKPVWVGDSQLIHNNKIHGEAGEKQQTMTSTQKQTSMCVCDVIQQKDMETYDALVLQKHDTNTRAIQETQLIGMEQYSRQTLNDKVDLEKVREIRRAIRRKYGNRKNFQKIFRCWDEDNKGAISVKNVLSMMKRFGLNMNLDEARVLIASADKSQTGMLALDDFMELIFNDNDAMNVNLKNLHVLSEQQQDALLQGNEGALIEFLQEDAKQTRVKRHQNQVNLVLKNKMSNIVAQFQAQDSLNLGYVNYEKLEALIKRLNIPDKIITEEDVRGIYQDFKQDEHTFDYKRFLAHLRDFELNVLDLYGGTPNELKKQKSSYQPLTSQFNLLLATHEDERLHVLDCNRANIQELEVLRTKANKMFEKIQRYLPTRAEFDKLVLGQHTTNATISMEDLNSALTSFLVTVGEKPAKKDIESMLSVMQYNNKHIPTRDIGKYVYEENDMTFYERCSLRINGPAPMTQSALLNYEPLAQKEEYDNNTIINSIASFYDRKLGLQSSAATLVPEMVAILQKVDNNTFLGSAKQYDIFKQFDKDRDGFVSTEDFITHVKQINLLTPKEIGHLLNYIDPHQKGSLTFNEFSSKIYPGMTTCNKLGEQLVVPHLFPAKERSQNMKNHLEDIKRVKSDQNFPTYEKATRFGSTPMHKNTFHNIQQPPTNSALYQSEQERFSKNPHSRTQFQSDEQSKHDQVYQNKLQHIRQHQDTISRRIEDNFQSDVQKDQAKRATKGLATFNYEQRAHLKNDWL